MSDSAYAGGYVLVQLVGIAQSTDVDRYFLSADALAKLPALRKALMDLDMKQATDKSLAPLIVLYDEWTALGLATDALPSGAVIVGNVLVLKISKIYEMIVMADGDDEEDELSGGEADALMAAWRLARGVQAPA
jgi:hypothetical protein